MKRKQQPLSFVQKIIICAILGIVFFGNLPARSDDTITFDTYIQSNEKALRAMYNPVSRTLFKARHYFGKPAWVMLDKVKGITADAITGAGGGLQGMVFAAAAGQAKHVAVALVRQYLENPQAIAVDLAIEAMNEALAAYDENYQWFKDGFSRMNDDQRRSFLENQAKIALYNHAFNLYEAARHDTRSIYSKEEINQAVARVETVFDQSSALGNVLFASDLIDAAAKSGLDVKDYEPYRLFLETKDKAEAYFDAIALGAPADPTVIISDEFLLQSREDNITKEKAIEVLPYAELALAVYGDTPLPVDWKEISTKKSLTVGFHTAAYQGPAGQIVIAFEGTNPLSPADWINNLGQTVTVPPQYRMALDYAENIIKQNPTAKITLTGHSLGGGLAQYAGGHLGRPTVTFNHAGLWAPAYFKTQASGNVNPADFIHVITQGFIFEEDLFVKSKQDQVSKLGGYLGTLVRVPMESPGWAKGYFYRHGMENLCDAIQAIASLPTQVAAGQAIIAVVDSSGSMKQTDPRNLRLAALNMMIDTLDDTAALGMVDFDSQAVRLADPSPLGAINSQTRHDLRKAIDRVDAAGQTRIREGLSMAAGMIENGGPQATVVLLTDGKDPNWHGESDMLPAGVPVHTIALSDKADRDALGKLAAASGGISEIARSADDLRRIISGLFGEAVGEEVLLVREGIIQQGDMKAYDVFVDDGHGALQVQVSWPGSDVDLTLVDPAGREYAIDDARQGGYGIEAATYDIIRIDRPAPGTWQARLLGVDLPPAGEPFNLRVAGKGSRHKTRWNVNVPVPEVGEPMTIDLAGQGDIQWQAAEIHTWHPDGRSETQSKTFGGVTALLGGDSGTTMLSMIPAQAGVLRVQITAEGTAPGGERVQRSFDRTFQVAAPGRGRRYMHEVDPFIRRTR